MSKREGYPRKMKKGEKSFLLKPRKRIRGDDRGLQMSDDCMYMSGERRKKKKGRRKLRGYAIVIVLTRAAAADPEVTDENSN